MLLTVVHVWAYWYGYHLIEPIDIKLSERVDKVIQNTATKDNAGNIVKDDDDDDDHDNDDTKENEMLERRKNKDKQETEIIEPINNSLKRDLSHVKMFLFIFFL